MYHQHFALQCRHNPLQSHRSVSAPLCRPSQVLHLLLALNLPCHHNQVALHLLVEIHQPLHLPLQARVLQGEKTTLICREELDEWCSSIATVYSYPNTFVSSFLSSFLTTGVQHHNPQACLHRIHQPIIPRIIRQCHRKCYVYNCEEYPNCIHAYLTKLFCFTFIL